MGLCYTFNGSDMFVENAGIFVSAFLYFSTTITNHFVCLCGLQIKIQNCFCVIFAVAHILYSLQYLAIM